ncbi:MAG: hypothetical protein AAF630_12395 [Cyanobacteria bacterium P01_C01_bin.38]
MKISLEGTRASNVLQRITTLLLLFFQVSYSVVLHQLTTRMGTAVRVKNIFTLEKVS